MTFISFITLLLLGLSASSRVKEPDSEGELPGEILRNEQRLLDAIALGDTTTWLNLLHPDCLIGIEDGSTISVRDFLATLKPLPAGFDGAISITDSVWHRYENTFVLSFIDDERLTLFGQHIHTRYRQTDTWTVVDGEWRLISLQLFEIPGNPSPVSVPSTVLERYAGTYRLGQGRTCTVTVREEALFARKNGRPEEELLAETETVFFRRDDARVRVLFVRKDPTFGYTMIERRAGEDVLWNRE